jgi:hypothetical protein
MLEVVERMCYYVRNAGLSDLLNALNGNIPAFLFETSVRAFQQPVFPSEASDATTT